MATGTLFRRWPRLTALLIGILPLVGVEGLCRPLGVADYRDRPDPFAGFSHLQTAFQRQVSPEGREIIIAREGKPARTRQFRAEKPEDGFRVFVFGGSSEAGTPYGYDFAFADFLQTLLSGALPQRTVEVVNCAVAGYASRRLLYLASEVSAYEPDLFIIATGHNEAIEQRLYSHMFGYPLFVFQLKERLRTLRLYILVEDALNWIRSPRRAEVDGEKIYVPLFGPLATRYWQDEPRDIEQQRFYARTMLRTNVDRMIRIAQQAGASVLLLSQSKNYVDWPVTDDTHRADLSSADLMKWNDLVARAREGKKLGDTAGAIRALEQALSLDPKHADTYRRLADLRRSRGEYAAAVELYRRAHNMAGANFGTTPGRNQVLAELAEQRGTLWLDVDRILSAASPNGLVGFNWFIDFLHPNLAAHQLIAQEIFKVLERADLPIAGASWRTPPPLPTPEALLAGNPELHAMELRIRILAEVVFERSDVAGELLGELRKVAPEDPQLDRLEKWVRGELPFDLDLMYGR
jgi:tetratricopeptide (TPR) repeat protein